MKGEDSSPGWIRTNDQPINSRLLPDKMSTISSTSDVPATGIPQNFPPHLHSDLARLVEKGPTLPGHIKAAVMALVNTAAPNPPVDPKALDGLERVPWEKREGQ
jgi:hypothetical protein